MTLIEIVTVEGIITCIRHHPPDVAAGADVPFTTFFLGGALGGLSGPGGLYQRMAQKYGGVRIHYRRPAKLDDCLRDLFFVYHYLARTGLERVAFVGHSFGGGLAMAGAVLFGPATAGVVTLATQLVGSELIGRLAGKPVLLIHGSNDTILPDRSSRNVYDRAAEPKELLILPGETHFLDGMPDVLDDRVGAFIAAVSST